MESLQGYFLISTPQMPDPRFKERVVYICAHTDEGAMGLIVNQPVNEVRLADVFLSVGSKVPKGNLPSVYLGGPVGLNSAFFLYSSDYKREGQMLVCEGVALSSDLAILDDISRKIGPQNYIFALGYSGWAPGQLENELTVNGWLALPGDEEILFHTPDELKWKRVAEKHGINITLFGDVIGNA